MKIKPKKVTKGLMMSAVLVLMALILTLASIVGNRNSFAITGGYPNVWANAPKDSATDAWGMLNRECTSFVAWKLSVVNGYNIVHGSKSWDAGLWGQRASELGIYPNNTPAVGAVAWWVNGHVAWVSAINGSNITIEEYNWYTVGGYNTRVISKSTPTGYIHLKDLDLSSNWGGINGMVSDKSDGLNKGQFLNPNHFITSADGVYVLAMQNDGNLVLYSERSALWASGTDGNPGAFLTLQNDGNLVVYKSDRATPLWATGSNATDTSRFIVQDDGNLVVYKNSGASHWASNTTARIPDRSYVGSDALSANKWLTAGQYIRSNDWRYTAVMQSDGNFVVYAAGGRPIWASNTGGNTGAKLVVQGDNNIVIYRSDGRAIWSTSTSNSGLNTLIMQNDGNLVGHADSIPKWASNTMNKF